MSLRFLTLFAATSAVIAFSPLRSVTKSSRLSMSFDLDKVLLTLSKNKVATKVGQLGLLSKLEKAGFKLSTAVPLLKIADKLDALGVLEASADKVLPLAAKAVDLAPALLPLADVALKTPSTVFYGAATASLAAAGLIVLTIPDDSITSIALQTLLVVPLGAVVPGALGVGGFLVSKLK